MAEERMTSSAMLERLVAFDTVSAKSNLALIDFVAGYLAGFGVEAVRDLAADGNKANLFATIGPAGDGGVVLSGHTDVVPVEGQAWTSDPFTMVARDGRLYGRGTADMKGFIATVLARVPAMRERTPARPVHLALSYDEEVGCLGVPSLLRRLGRDLPKPALAVIGEPTEMKVVDRHKGVYAFETVVSGVPAHSSSPQLGLNAIAYGGEVIACLNRLAQTLRSEGERDDAFDPPFASVNLGRINGGTAVNIIAEKCRIVWEFRPLPGADAEAIEWEVRQDIDRSVLAPMRAENALAAIETRRLAIIPALISESEASEFALHLMGQNHTEAVPFGTEAGLFQAHDIPAVVCGPGSVKQAHQPDEFVAEEQLAACERFLDRLIDWACD